MHDAYGNLIESIATNGSLSGKMLSSKSIEKGDKESLIVAMLRNGTGREAQDYLKSIGPDNPFFHWVKAHTTSNFTKIVIDSLNYHPDVRWAFQLCSDGDVALLCRLICLMLDQAGEGIPYTRVGIIITDIINGLCGIPALLKEPQFAHVLSHANATEKTLPNSVLNVQRGMNFAYMLSAKKLTDTPKTTPAQAAKTLIDYPEIVVQCIDSMTQVEQHAEAQVLDALNF